jgi:hypothetical protein
LDRKYRKTIIAGLSFLIFTIVFVAWMLIEPFMLKTEHIIVKDEDVPSSFEGFKIVFISDIHHRKLSSVDAIEKVVERSNRQDPDIVILGGDYTESRSDADEQKKYMEEVFSVLDNLTAKYGVYVVSGNHDHTRYGVERGLSGKTNWNVTEQAEKVGFTVIDNDSEWISIGDERIKIGGVDDMWFGEQDIEATVADTTVDDFVILVSHNPDMVEELETEKVDLMLSGHTHAGQVTFFGLWAPYIPSDYGNRYRYGLYETDKTQLYVTSGTGTNALPVRFFAQPEVAVITLSD